MPCPNKNQIARHIQKPPRPILLRTIYHSQGYGHSQPNSSPKITYPQCCSSIPYKKEQCQPLNLRISLNPDFPGLQPNSSLNSVSPLSHSKAILSLASALFLLSQTCRQPLNLRTFPNPGFPGL